MTLRTLAPLLLLLLIAPVVAQDDPAPLDPPAVEEFDPAAEMATGEDPRAVPLEDIRRYVSVFRTVKQAYVDEVGDQALMQAAIRGLLTDLDPHSSYLDKEQSQRLSESASGAYDGIGLELVQQPDRSLLVIAPIDDTPAARAGIEPGDLIVAIDGEPIEADSVEAAVEQLRGEPGTQIERTVLREGESSPLVVAVTRETINITSVRGRLLEPGYGYVRISTFQADTGPELRRRLVALGEGSALRGLVLDLRSNPGGLLNAAVEAADAFLDAGLIVSTKGRLAFANAEYSATPGDLLAGAPIVVLVDSGTASASEVLAGALRDHRRALVMGSRTFGKGSVQTVMPLDNGDAIKLTTARYYTPSGRSIQAAGVRPDVPLAEGAQMRSAGNRPPSVRERDLPGHLRGDDHEEPQSDDPAGAAQADADADADYAIRAALDLLKGLSVFDRGGERATPGIAR
jgi:carboxyl-terminal processing protease